MATRRMFEGVFLLDGKLATLNLVKGRKAYTEELVTVAGKEYRLWNPYRSKLAGAIINGLRNFHFRKGSGVLYLGASTGTTPSHVSDIVGNAGRIYAVDISERSVQKLVEVCETRKNMLPILADARDTAKYEKIVEPCDIIYQDVSSRDQADILLANSKFLKKDGAAYFIIKSQSISIAKKPETVFKNELAKLNGVFALVETVSLEPYDSMHMFAVLKKL